MTQYNPYKDSFEQSKDFSQYAETTLWISTILIGVSFTLKFINPSCWVFWETELITAPDKLKLVQISEFINNINIFFIISFAVLSFLSDIFFYQASIQRREDFIDNSFNSNIAEDRSKEYYTNENITSGMYKIAVNSFENAFFSYNIASKMTPKLWVKHVTFALLVLIFAVFGYNDAFILLIQLTLPILLLHKP